ncbi:methyltransferase domain-containing protein [Geomonas edaphica]|uniref:methyltransferase domain-containing protein n=1 Tax=Geomonas edaphica TaxID=2570226 RepID=UPI0010A7C6DC|nr:methyltransferase domain-containing protein [Geomonas edaphica]
MRILHIPLEFMTWRDASHFPYSSNLAFEEGFAANDLEFVTIPACFKTPALWLDHARSLCARLSFDQIWLEAVHTSYPDDVLEWLREVAPVRIGIMWESCAMDPLELIGNPEGARNRERNIARNMECLTHLLVVDEKDEEHYNAAGRVQAKWIWDAGFIPGRFASGPAPSKPIRPEALFYGALYGERKQWLEHPRLRGLLLRPETSLEYGTDIPRLWDELHLVTLTMVERGEQPGKIYDNYMRQIRELRRRGFDLWLEGLRDGIAVVNLPQFGKAYASRVIEGMAAGRPVVTYRMPDRPRTMALFEPEREILLYDRDSPEELAEILMRLRREPGFGEAVAEAARRRIRERHTTEELVSQVLKWTKGAPAATRPQVRPGSETATPSQRPGGSAHLPLEEIHDFNQRSRDRWVSEKATSVPAGSLVLDVGAGTCPYRPLFSHCSYKTHDFKGYTGEKLGGTCEYGQIDYVSEITELPIADQTFDVLLCTEVLEHVPDPAGALREMQRVLKPGGRLLLTAPLGSGLHQLPYHYYGGFSPAWYQYYAEKFGLRVVEITPNGGFYRLLAQECVRAGHFISQQFPAAEIPGNLIQLLVEELPRLLFGYEDRHFIDQFTVGYHVELVKDAEVSAR